MVRFSFILLVLGILVMLGLGCSAEARTPDPTPPRAPSTVVAPANRADCAAIDGTTYQSEAERNWYHTNCANRKSCTLIQGTAYQSDYERNWYLANCQVSRGPAPPSQPPAPSQPRAPEPAPPTGCPTGCLTPPPGCFIKGNVSFDTGERIYHVPSGQYYAATIIDTRYGERWFCTDAEALANGWRKSQR